MKNKYIKTAGQLLILSFLLLSFGSCKKYLDEKPDKSINTPSTIDDLEGILNNYGFMNARYPSAAEVSSDDYYLTDADWAGLAIRQRNFYSWTKSDDIGGDYTSAYVTIFYSNIMLESLDKVDGDKAKVDEIRGGGLFTRAACHFALAGIFAPAYNKSTATTDLGIALRLKSDIADKPQRSNNEDTYNSIISDLKNAIPLLSPTIQLKYRPSKPAAYGLLARVYLAMRDYQHAGLYADSCLHLYNTLIDYNSINAGAPIPFAQFNDEVIYDARASPPSALAISKAKIDTNLFRSYELNDLRQTVLFKTNTNGSKAFKGNYTGQNNASVFTGIATDEMYLIRAECAARNNLIPAALQDINNLLSKRWKTGFYTLYNESDPNQILIKILKERRKELLFRNMRWTDLRRLNYETSFSQTIYRKLNNQVLSLAPGSLRYVLQIDKQAVKLSGLIQNP